MSLLSVGQYSAIELTPLEFIACAKAMAVNAVSLMANPPGPGLEHALVTQDNITQVKGALEQAGLHVLNIECFLLTPKTQIDSFKPICELAQELGASGLTALIYDDNEDRVKQNLRDFCALAREYQLKVNIEFMAMTPKWNSLDTVADLIANLQEPNLGIALDVLHLIRSGGTVETLASIEPKLISYCQLCDGNTLEATNNYVEEAGSRRLAPGDGIFPLQELLKTLGGGIPLEIEVPFPAQEQPTQARLVSTSEKTKSLMAAAD